MMGSIKKLKGRHNKKTSVEIDDNDISKLIGRVVTFKIRKKYWKRFSLIVALAAVVLVGTSVAAYMKYTLDGITHEKEEEIIISEEEFEVDSDEMLEIVTEEATELDWEDLGYNTASMDGVTNVLLCGEEAMAESKVGARGRTDCIIIATVNNNQKTLKLTSIMRDTYVKIPGYSNNKINAAYSIGGMPLLLKTIEVNFGIKLDGYILVGFDGFEDIINALGGVEISLTKTEADYLNKTNYISNKENRNVKEGKNLMNGNQALGYSRVRYVSTGTGLANDYGRNYRQRTLLVELFNRYRNSSVTDIIALLPKITKLITTNIDDTTIMSYIANVLTLGATEIETYKIPVDEFYKGARVRSMAVLYITDINGTRSRLHKYIFGDELDVVGKEMNYYGENYSNSSNKTTSSKESSVKEVNDKAKIKKEITVKDVNEIEEDVVDLIKEDETVVEESVINDEIKDTDVISEENVVDGNETIEETIDTNEETQGTNEETQGTSAETQGTSDTIE